MKGRDVVNTEPRFYKTYPFTDRQTDRQTSLRCSGMEGAVGKNAATSNPYGSSILTPY